MSTPLVTTGKYQGTEKFSIGQLIVGSFYRHIEQSAVTVKNRTVGRADPTSCTDMVAYLSCEQGLIHCSEKLNSPEYITKAELKALNDRFEEACGYSLADAEQYEGDMNYPVPDIYKVEVQHSHASMVKVFRRSFSGKKDVEIFSGCFEGDSHNTWSNNTSYPVLEVLMNLSQALAVTKEDYEMSFYDREEKVCNYEDEMVVGYK